MILFLLALLVAPAAVRAQEANPQSLYGRDSTQGVYVRDSAVAIEKFALAERMERLKEWTKSADVYQEILQSYSDRVVPSQVDSDNRIYQYTSVAISVQDVDSAQDPDEVGRGAIEFRDLALRVRVEFGPKILKLEPRWLSACTRGPQNVRNHS